MQSADCATSLPPKNLKNLPRLVLANQISTTSKILRGRALKCQRLAGAMGDLELIKALTAMAAEYEAGAAEADAKLSWSDSRS
jgi:hypothetical protein